MKIILNILLSIFLLQLVISCGQNRRLEIANIRIEYLTNPIGIDVAHPRFSWIIKDSRKNTVQSAYHIQVAGSRSKLKNNEANIWDTGRLASGQSTNIPFEGTALQSDKGYYYRIKVYTNHDRESNWSAVNHFHTGLLSKADWTGTWIGARDSTISSPLFRKECSITKPIQKAHIFISGLGLYELYINGEKVGNHLLDPATTNYNKRALYASYDVSNYLKNGNNAMGVWLGNGYLKNKGTRKFGDRPQFILQLNIRFKDGTSQSFVSDTNWTFSHSPIKKNSIYDGEFYDAREENQDWSSPNFDDQNWQKATYLKVPESRKLEAQLMPPIRVQRTIEATTIIETYHKIYVYDFGENITGVPILRVKGKPGREVRLKTAEITQGDKARMENDKPGKDNSRINNRTNRDAKSQDNYILKGSNQTEQYQPRFTYHGFRYLQVRGYPGKPTKESLKARVLRSDVQQTGYFHSSDTLLNKIHGAIVRTQKGNLMGIPTDSPQRSERQGWLGDAHITAREAMYNFDMASFYTNYLRNIQLSQHKDGSIPDVVPNHSYNSVGTPAWQSAYPLLVWQMYQFYGDKRIIKENYKNLQKWMRYMSTLADNYIINTGRGDWLPPFHSSKPTDGSIPITSTGYYYKSSRIMSELASVLQKKEDEKNYRTLADNIQHAFNKRFYHPADSSYGSGSQTSNIFPVYAGLATEGMIPKVLEKLHRDILQKKDGHLNTGVLGTKALVETLPKYGYADLLYKMATKTSYPGWGYMIQKGATTLWERWGGLLYFSPPQTSLSHIMFGSLDTFFYEDLGGIKAKSPGFKDITISPKIPRGLKHVKASVQTMRGKVSSEWRKNEHSIELFVSIPANSTAIVEIPKADLESELQLKENGKIIWSDKKTSQNSQQYKMKEQKHSVLLAVRSGDYEFLLSGQPI